MTHPDFLRLTPLLSLLLSPIALFSQPLETMPTTIPDEIVNDWKKQDEIKSDYSAAIKKIKSSLPEQYASKITGTSSQTDYLNACHLRRVAKMKPHLKYTQKIIYAKHYNQGNAIVGFLSGLGSDRGGNWAIGSGLYILTMDSYYPKPVALLEDATGVIKDPCVSFDGTKVVFAWWKNSDRQSGYHIYEIDVATKETRQITRDPLDLKVGDYEPCYLPTGDIMFNSSRSFSINDDSYNIICNFYLCNGNGDWLRRIGYDQMFTFHPVMMSNGKVLYSRKEFNDRNRTSCGAYFTMNPDGTNQTEYWGNQSDFPLIKYQAREIPNSGGKLMGIAGDYLAPYQGEIVIIDPKVSRNNVKGSENESIKLIAPIRKAPVDPSTILSGNSGGAIKYLFQNPWPFDTNNCLVSWRQTEKDTFFNIYFFSADASRELLAWDSNMSVSQPVVMDARPKPPTITPQVDYSKETGIFQVNNVYHGTGSKGVAAGKITKLRVIALDHRTNYSNSSGVLGFSVNPIGRANSSWLAKTLLGEIPVEKDGSACFTVPANTPVFFQTVDADGRMVNTMRSWTTLMPGERFTCTGCHEDKNEPVQESISKNPLPFVKRLGIEDKGFSFPAMIQPILDRNCVLSGCHDAGHESLWLQADPVFNSGGKKTFNSSYTNLTKKQKMYVDWITQESKAAPITTFPAPGSGTSPLADTLLKGHNSDKNKMTPEEREILFVWMDMMVPHGGTYYEGMKAEDSIKYVTYLNNYRNKHIEWEKINIKAFVDAGQWNNAIYHEGTTVDDNRYLDKLKAMTDATGQLQIIRVTGSLTVQCPGTGMISLLNMTGRTLIKVSTTSATKCGGSQAILPLKMPAGIYILRFNGNGMVRQHVLTYLTPRGDRF